MDTKQPEHTVATDAEALDLLGSIGLFDHIEIALHLPIALWQDGDPYSIGGTQLEAGGGLGDLRLVPKGVFYRTTGSAVGIALGATLPITFPTGNSEALRGADAVTFEPRFLFGVLGERWSVSTRWPRPSRSTPSSVRSVSRGTPTMWGKTTSIRS